ncbi:MAG TPA: tRNA (adenosine(37)-N6)-dimethylallyltransferase MiaA [Steroidobacteraceae bacterium]|jgi:tRNA dimethylallyltransferase|nr:tRNA (adenosine(37)-N6)-dimethylallyltransferase MiaA [Steroidobacteraceae bacterium]
MSGAEAGELPVLILAGPTGAGKTDWAIRLAGKAPVEIVSVDSALVYRGLDIGTAKPARELRQRVPHHLIDICEPTESYSAGRFVADALASIRAIHGRRRVPLLVGGTMLYLRSLLDGLAELPQADPRLRAELDARALQHGWPALHAELARLDPETAARIAPADSQRIQRALEVCYTTGRPISQLQRATVSPLEASAVHYWMLSPPRALLHERIASRFAGMMDGGFLDEIVKLRQDYALTARHPSMRAVGYRQLWAHLDGQYPLEEAVRRAVAATRQLAKRQLTWMRGEPRGRWIDPGSPESELSWNRDICKTLGQLGLGDPAC